MKLLTTVIASNEAVSLDELGTTLVAQWDEWQTLERAERFSRMKLGETLDQIHRRLSNHRNGTWRKFLSDRSISHATAERVLADYRRVRKVLGPSLVVDAEAEEMKIDLTAKPFKELLEAHKDELRRATEPEAAREVLTTIVKEEKLSNVAVKSPEDRRRDLRESLFSRVNYYTAGMTEQEIVEELTALVKKILATAEVSITLPTEKVVPIAS